MNEKAKRKIITYIGFAIKARKVLYGADSIAEFNKKIHLIFYTKDINRTSLKRLNKVAEEREIKIISIEGMLMKDFVKKDNCKAIAIRDFNLANAIKKELEVNVNE